MKKVLILSLLFTVLCLPQNIIRVEYFIDTDPGIGNGTSVPIGTGTDQTVNFNAPISSLPNGFHSLFVRSVDENGKWSNYAHRTFYKDSSFSYTPPLAKNIVQMESFIDFDPGIGKGLPVSIGSGSNQTIAYTVQIPDQPLGFHQLFIRAKDERGKWSNYAHRTFYKAESFTPPVVSAKPLAALEYFYDTDPGFWNGTTVELDSSTDQTVNFLADISKAGHGFHTFFVRARDVDNKWSGYASQNFFVAYEWTGAQDSLWNNPFNWNPVGIPPSTGRAYIASTAISPVLGKVGGNATIGALDIRTGGKLSLLDSTARLNTVGDLKISGTLRVLTEAKPIIEVGGNWINLPEAVTDLGFIPGQSTVKFKGSGYVANNFYNITMDSAANMLSSGIISVQNNYVRNKGNLNLRAVDTLLILNKSPFAIQGSGGIINRGTITRAIDTITTDSYQFESKDTYIKFNSGSSFPELVNMTNYPDTNSNDFGKYWAEVPGTVDVVNNIVTADNITQLGVWAIGEGAGKLDKTANILVKPRVRRVYAGGSGSTLEKSAALKMGGLNFKLSLRYEQSEVEAGADETKFKILRLTDSTVFVRNEVPVIPKEYALSQNYPNPFNPATRINYAIMKREMVTLKIFDILGNEIVRLVNEIKEPGTYSVEFNAARLSSGIYFYRIQSGSFLNTKKMTILK